MHECLDLKFVCHSDQILSQIVTSFSTKAQQYVIFAIEILVLYEEAFLKLHPLLTYWMDVFENDVVARSCDPSETIVSSGFSDALGS
jgi:hypothetical protein